MSRRLLALAAALCLTALATLLLAGHGPWAGRTLVALGGRHGINVGDLPVFGLWAGGIGACVLLSRKH